MSSLWLDQERLEHPVYPAYPAIAPPSFPCRPGSSILIDGHFESSLTETQARYGTGKKFAIGGRSLVTIDMLPDVALLEIFDFYVFRAWREEWHTLVHVCRKWRNIVLGSPRRLDLRLYCTARTPVRETLDVWPPFPIIISSYGHEKWGVDDIVAAFEHNHRICELNFFKIKISSSQFKQILAAMQQPFPELTILELSSRDETALVDHDLFLSGSAPRLQLLSLHCIAFLGLPKLLLSATHLVYLDLWSIPHSGYISPEAMATSLSVLTRLQELNIGFKSPRSRPDRKSGRLPPPTHKLFPVFRRLRFKGVSEYLEDLVARIDAPLLYYLGITFFHQLIFDTPHLSQFIARTPNLKTQNEARVLFSDRGVWVKLPQTFQAGIPCRQSDWQLSSMAQVCSSSVLQALIPAVEHLYILEDAVFPQRLWQDDIESSQWLELFHPFTAVKDLYISSGFIPRVLPTLQELVRGRVTEVLPALETLFLEEPLPSGTVQETIEQLVDARQLAGHPIVVSPWAREGERVVDKTDDV